MKWRSLPAWIPNALLRHPVLLADCLQITNRFARQSALLRGLIVSTSIAIVLGLCFLARSEYGARIVSALAEYWVLTAIVSALFALSSVSGRRRARQQTQAGSWLIAAPIAPESARLADTIHLLAPVVLMSAVICLFCLITEVPRSDTAIGAIVMGMLVGAVLAATAKSDQEGGGVTESRYARAPAQSTLTPSLDALSHWPIAQVRAWSRPDNARYVLVIALLAVQGGSSIGQGLSVVGLYFFVSFLATSASAWFKVARLAQRWLSSTPIKFHEIVWALSKRTLMYQVLAMALAAICLVFMSMPGRALR